MWAIKRVIIYPGTKKWIFRQCVRWLIFSREKFTYSLFNYGQHKSQLISSNSIPPSYIGLIFHYYFYWWHFWIFTRSIGGFLLKDQRAMRRRLNWIITQLKIFMAAHHITKEPLSYLSSPHPPALLGPPYLFLRSIDHSVENCLKKVLINSEFFVIFFVDFFFVIFS